MDEEDPIRRAGREAAAKLPSPPPEVYRELIRHLQAIKARQAAQQPEAVARRKRVGEVRAEMRLTCERYLGREITLATLTRGLRFLEEQEGVTSVVEGGDAEPS